MMEVKKLVPELRFKGFDEEWKIVSLNNFASINPKNTEIPESFIYIDLESVTKGILLKEDIIFKENSPSRAQRLLQKNDILYQTVRPYQMNNFYFDKIGHYVASTGYAQIRTENNSKFLFHFLHTEKFVQNVMLRCTGTSYPAINSSDLSKIKINFPSLPEQQKIASFLSAVDEKTQQLTRKKELLEQYKKGVMQQIFSGKLRFKDENGKEYADWELHQIEDLVKRKILDKPLDGNHGSIHPVSSDFVSKGIPFVMANNIRNGKLNLEGVTCIKKEQADKLQKGFSIEGDVLLTHKGSVGLSAIVQKLDTDYIMLTPQVTYYRILESQKLVNTFLKIVFDSSLFQKRLQTLADSGTRPYIGITLQRTLEIPLPSVNEQKKIANFLSGIDEKIESTTQQINQTQTFKKGLLQKMFV